MSIRGYTIAAFGLVAIGAGIWWAHSTATVSEIDKSLAQSIVAGTADSPTIEMQVSPEALVQNTSAVEEPVQSGSRGSDASSQEVEKQEGSAIWSARALAFSKREDSDPALARELEFVIQRFMLTRVEPSRYEAQVVCRGSTCQILAVDGAPGADNGWNLVIAQMLRELGGAALRHPLTGVDLGGPKLQEVAISRSSPPSYATTLRF